MHTRDAMAALLDGLRAQLDEDERLALATLDASTARDRRNGLPVPRWYYRSPSVHARHLAHGPVLKVKVTWDGEGLHIVRHDPHRVLAGVAGKRRILADFETAIAELRAAQTLLAAWRGVDAPDAVQLGIMCAQVKHAALHRAVTALLSEYGVDTTSRVSTSRPR